MHSSTAFINDLVNIKQVLIRNLWSSVARWLTLIEDPDKEYMQFELLESFSTNWSNRKVRLLYGRRRGSAGIRSGWLKTSRRTRRPSLRG